MKLSLALVFSLLVITGSACTNEGSSCCPRGPAGPSSTVPGIGGHGSGDRSVVLGVVGSPATLDPYSPVASQLTYELAVPVYPSLFRFAPNGVPHPYLARQLENVPGGVRVTLRPARWSDGSPVSAADVVRTWRRARRPSGLSAVTSARALGPRVVELRGKVGDWKQALATLSYVLPGGRPKRLSAGPFRVESYKPGLQIAFVRNRQWWARPALKGLKVEFVQSLQVLLLLLGRGRIDAAAPPSSVNLDDRLQALGLNHSDALGWESVQLRFPGNALDRTERMTLAGAVNRKLLTTGFVRDEGRSSTTLHPQPGPGGARGQWSHPYPAGLLVDRPITLSAPTGDELLELTQRALQSQLSTATGDVELVGIDPQTFYGPWQVHHPTELELTRVAGAPGLAGGRDAYDRATSVPLFQTETVIAWRDGVAGPRANPTFDGPLWNAEAWSIHALQ